jgi:hypothetical protein
LSFQEMNELTYEDIFTMADIFVGDNENKPKEATQEDIDRFYRSM